MFRAVRPTPFLFSRIWNNLSDIGIDTNNGKNEAREATTEIRVDQPKSKECVVNM